MISPCLEYCILRNLELGVSACVNLSASALPALQLYCGHAFDDGFGVGGELSQLPPWSTFLYLLPKQLTTPEVDCTAHSTGALFWTALHMVAYIFFDEFNSIIAGHQKEGSILVLYYDGGANTRVL